MAGLFGLSVNLPPIHNAAAGGDAARLRQLLEQGVSPDLRTEGGSTTPLHKLCNGVATSGDAEVCFRLLMDADADLEAVDRLGNVPLWYAVKKKHELALMLIEAGAAVDATNHYGCTPLHNAGRFGTEKTVTVLLRAGADVNARDQSGKTPLECAIMYRNYRVRPILLRAGAEIDPLWQFNVHDPYLARVAARGGFKQYEQAHLAQLTMTFAPKFSAPGRRLPPEVVRKVLEFWLHAGYY